MASVKSIMRRDLVLATKDEDVSTAIERMIAQGVGALLVVCDGRVCGILSECDVLRKVILAGREPRDTRVGSVAVAATVLPREASVAECAELIRRHDLREVAIVDDERRPVGVVSARELLGFVIEAEEP